VSPAFSGAILTTTRNLNVPVLPAVFLSPSFSVININFKGKPTRHLIKTNDHDDILRVNKKSYGPHTTLESLIDALSGDELPAGWPIKLNRTIDRDSGKTISSRPQRDGAPAHPDESLPLEPPAVVDMPAKEPPVEPLQVLPEPAVEPESEEPADASPNEDIHAWYHGVTVRLPFFLHARWRLLLFTHAHARQLI
jgi:hypothetical protein